MPAAPNYENLQIYFQCRVEGCIARCQASPKESGRLGDHWKKEHLDEYGPFNGREVLVKTRNADGTFASTTFDAYLTANGIKYKTQDSPRPSRHTNKAATPLPSTTKVGALMAIPSSLPARATVNMDTATAFPTSFPTSNLRRVARMERQLRLASMPARIPQEEPGIRDTLDSHPDRSQARNLPQRSASTCVPLKRNLSQAFSDAKSKPTQAPSHTTVTASAPAKLPFSQPLISHLCPAKSPPLLPRTTFDTTQALRGSLGLPSHVGDDTKKDYSHNRWSCEMCHVDFPDLQSVTVHLRDHHAVEEDVVTLTPDRDVITMVLASVRIHDGEHGWVDENGKAIRSPGETDDETETDEEMQAE